MKLRRVICAAALVLLQLCCSNLLAQPTTARQAESVVKGWLRADARPLGAVLGQQIARIETFTDDYGQEIYYIVYLKPSGFVILPADDLIDPIVGFADDGTYDPSLDNPLGALVTNDLNGRIAAVRDTQGIEGTTAMETALKAQAKWQQLESLADRPVAMGLPSISDVRVAPLVQSKWAQTTCCAPVPDPCALACYNYYTPLSDPWDPCDYLIISSPNSPHPYGDPCNYPCGCVATAMAQLMRYHEHPSTAIGKRSFRTWTNNDGNDAWTRGSDGKGSPYNWGQMELEPNCSTIEQKRQAIGALCYDASVSVNMNYSSSGSSASLYKAGFALVLTFQYSNAIYGYSSGMDISGPGLNGMVNPNLDYEHPVIIGIAGGPYDDFGHAVVADGYGYNFSTLYHHLNMGWAGTQDAWYHFCADMPPGYTIVFGCVYNVFVSGTGEIISGRITDRNGNPIGGATVTAQGASGPYSAITDSNGIYALAKLPSNTPFTVSANEIGYNFNSQNVKTGFSQDFVPNSGNLWGIDFVEVLTLYVDDDAPGDPCAGDPTFSDPNEDGSAGHPFDAIQEAFNAVYAEGTVVVLTGTYTGVGNRDIDFGGKAITVRSSDPYESAVVAATVIDCQGSGRAFYFHTSEGPTSIIDGLTIINGYSTYGGAIRIQGANPSMTNCTFAGNSDNSGGAIFIDGSPKLTNCTFVGNSAAYGGAVYSNSGYPRLTNCRFVGNSANVNGGGMVNSGASLTLVNCTFSGNSAADYGGGLCGFYGDLTLANCTFSGNTASNYGGGMYIHRCNPMVTNSIFWSNTASYGPQIALTDQYAPHSNLTISYSDIQGGQAAIHVDAGCSVTWGAGNIDLDPNFLDPNGPDNMAGTMDDNLRLLACSPCIDTGDNNSVPLDSADLDNDGNTAEQTPLDLDEHHRFVDGDCNDTVMADMGAYEFSYAYLGDFDGDCAVYYNDLRILANAWLTQPLDSFWNWQCDVYYPRNRRIDWFDYAIFADNWSIIVIPFFNPSFERGTFTQFYDDPYTGPEILNWVPRGWTFYEEDAKDNCAVYFTYCNTADGDDPDINSYAKPDTNHRKTGKYSAKFYAKGNRLFPPRFPESEYMENAMLFSNETTELPEYVSFWVFSENNVVDGNNERFGHQLVLYMCDADGCTRSVQCNIWRDISGSGDAYMHSCTGGQTTSGAGPDANEIGADGETWYRYTEKWPAERTNPPFHFKIEAQGHRWGAGTYSLTYFWVDDAGFSDEFGNLHSFKTSDSIVSKLDLAILCDNWLAGR